MKYFLTIVLAVSSITFAQDAPQIPGWGVYVGGALNGHLLVLVEAFKYQDFQFLYLLALVSASVALILRMLMLILRVAALRIGWMYGLLYPTQLDL